MDADRPNLLVARQRHRRDRHGPKSGGARVPGVLHQLVACAMSGRVAQVPSLNRRVIGSFFFQVPVRLLEIR